MVKIKSVRIIKRSNNYQIYYYNPNGERRRISVGNNYQNAQRMAVKFNDLLFEGKDPEVELKTAQQREKEKAITLKDLFPKFMERHAKLQSYSMQKYYQHGFKNICRCPSLVDIEIGSISKSLVLDYMHARMENDGVKPATVNREASLLKCILSRAVEWGILEHNPILELRLLKEADKREVNLTTEQASALIDELPESITNIVEFAIYTGFRKENILGLRIESIRFHDLTPTGEVELIVKGGRKELFPLGSAAIEVLKRAIGKRREDYVFINPTTKIRYISIHKTFDKAVRKLRLTVNGSKFRFHDLRHVFATWLHREGVPLDALRPLMGHKNRSTTDRYTTIDRLATGKLLNLMPQIRTSEHKKTLTRKESRQAINDF